MENFALACYAIHFKTISTGIKFQWKKIVWL